MFSILKFHLMYFVITTVYFIGDLSWKLAFFEAITDEKEIVYTLKKFLLFKFTKNTHTI